MSTRRGDAPLIVTAHLGADCFAIVDDLRRRYFPAPLNQIPAARVGFELEPLGLRFLGRGVAIGYAAGELATLRGTLAQDWADWLSPQDRQPFKPHVTIQNKVAPEVARALLDSLRDETMPICRIEGLRIWRYLGGPWEAVETCAFSETLSTA